jgi:hypothetical protein
MAFGDDFDDSVGHFYGGLIVNPVGRDWYLGSHSFYVGRRTFRVVLVIQVRKQRKVNQAQALILGSAVSSSTPNDFQPNSMRSWRLIR